MIVTDCPKKLGYRMPAEWEKQSAIWLTWPKDPITWPNVFLVQNVYVEIIEVVSSYQLVNILVDDEKQQQEVYDKLKKAKVNLSNVRLHKIVTADAWIRDYGPTFVINKNQLAMINWEFNAWGNKYETLTRDNEIPIQINKELKLPIFEPKIVLEGGSIEVDGKGTLIVTEQCLLNENRNSHLTRDEIEKIVSDHINVSKVIWLKAGIEGDDTDGHIDDITRFVAPSTVVTCIENDEKEFNYKILQENLLILKNSTDVDGKPFDIVELPMPEKIYERNQPLPASYANFLITNEAVLVPIYGCKNDQKALQILKEAFPSRNVVGFNCEPVIWGYGSIHCLSQQQPLVPAL